MATVRLACGRFRCLKKYYSTLILHRQKQFQCSLQGYKYVIGSRPSGYLKTHETFRQSSSLLENLEQKQCVTIHFSDLIQPVEYEEAIKEINTPHLQRNFQKKFEEILESFNLPNKTVTSVKVQVDRMISNKSDHCINSKGTQREKLADYMEGLVIITLLDACMEYKDKEFYLSVVYFIERNMKKPIGIKLLGKCVECMAECGWYDLGKRNIRSVFDGGSMLNSSAILKLMQVYVRQGDFKFAAELMVVLKQSMTKSVSIAKDSVSIDKTYDRLMRSLMGEILGRDGNEKERRELAKELLFLYQRDEGPDGWSKERAESVVRLLRQSGRYSIKTSLLHSSGKCPNCTTELLHTGIPTNDQARLRLRVFRKIRRLEVKYKGTVSRLSSPIWKLVEVMWTREYGLVVDGLNVQFWSSHRKGQSYRLFSSMREITDRRKLVILRSYLKHSVKNLFDRESDFDIFYVDNSIDDDLYLMCAGLFGPPDILVLTNDFLRDKVDLLDTAEMSTLLKRWKQTHLLQLESITKKYHQCLPGYKVQSPEAVYNGHSHILFSQGSSNYCVCIHNGMDIRDD